MANTIPEIHTFVGDTAPAFRFNVVRKGGEVVDLTGATIEFRIINTADEVVTNDLTDDGAVEDGPGGIAVYQQVAGDFPVAGCYRGYLKITYPTTRVETSEVKIEVSDVA